MSLLSQYHFKGRQEQAATDPNPAIAVTAGAGSGKTLSLVGRYLHLLEQGYPLHSILAITFTEKAAREMRSRIRAAFPPLPVLGDPHSGADGLEASAAGSDSTLDRVRSAARIGTIHSLCAEILRAYPAEAGLDPAFGVLEEGLSAALQAEAVDAALTWAVQDQQSVALFAVFKESELRQVLTTLLGRRLDIFSLPALELPAKNAQEKQDDAREKFSTALAAYLASQLDSPAWLDPISDLATYRAAAPDDKLELSRQSVLADWDEVRRACSAHNWDAVLSGLAALRKSIETRGGRKDAWDPSDLAAVRADMGNLKEIYEENLKFLAEKSCFALDEQVAAQIPAIVRLLDQTLREYQRRKDQRQALDFDDLEGLTASLLTGHPVVCARLRSELRAVLVDEFQDTNERQRQIVYGLTGFSPTPGGNFPIEAGREGGRIDLFIVGDSKQSIYKFRGADVSVFRQVQADVQAAGGERLDLDLTFRAHNSLLESINSLLAPILGETDDPARPYRIPFAPLHAYRQTPARENIRPPYVEFHLGLGENVETGRQSAAVALAGRLRQLHKNEGFAWGDMALLFRSSGAYPVYETALESAGIPFVTIAGRGFYDRPEIRDLLNALAAIADPADNLALAGLLRSPAFAIPDANLYCLRFPSPVSLQAGAGLGTRDLFPPPAAVSSWGTAGEGVQRAYAILVELRALAGRAPAAAVLKRFLDLTGYRAILTSVPNGSRMLRNVEKLLADAHRSRLVSLPGFLSYVQTLRDVGLREGEAPADSATSGSVQLMTIHKAKGLEFPVTILADAAHESHARAGSVLLAASTSSGQSPENLLLDIKENDLHPTAWQLAARLETDRDAAEDARLLYVAATRAEEKLLISSHVKRKKSGELDLNGWLSRLGEIVGLDKIIISEEMSQPESFPSCVAGISVVVYPVSTVAADSPQPISTPSAASPRKSDLLESIVPMSPVSDEKIRARESDPPQRVWRIVSTTKRPGAPAWVVGKLVHEALHRWRFPDADFENFLRPFALESGLTDPPDIHAAIQESRRLLERLRAHPIFAEMDAAERHHEIPYFLAGGRGVIDLFYRTPAGWFLVDFKTDEIRSDAEAVVAIREKGYDIQAARYARAVADQLKVQVKTRLVFLNVNDRLALFDL